MTSDSHARRQALLGRFRVAAQARLDEARRAAFALDEGHGESEDSVARLRRALHTIKGDAQMLGLDSLACFAGRVHDQVTAAPSDAAVRQILVGLEWLQGWSKHPLIEDDAAERRLREGEARLGEQAANEADARGEGEAEGPSSSPGGGRSVLLVDDSALVLMMVEDSLLDAGFRVETASSGDEALSAVAAAAPDLVVSGVKMPGMTGFELLSALRARHPGLPVVLLSGVRSPADEARARELGAQGYFLKDADLAPLITHVLAHVGA